MVGDFNQGRFTNLVDPYHCRVRCWNWGGYTWNSRNFLGLAGIGSNSRLMGHRSNDCWRLCSHYFLVHQIYRSESEKQSIVRPENDAPLLCPDVGNPNSNYSIYFTKIQMMVVWNGAPSLHLNDLSAATIAGVVIGVICVSIIVTILFFYPFLYRRLIMEDWKLRWYVPAFQI